MGCLVAEVYPCGSWTVVTCHTKNAGNSITAESVLKQPTQANLKILTHIRTALPDTNAYSKLHFSTLSCRP